MEAFYYAYLEKGLIGKLGYELGDIPFFLAGVLCVIVAYLLGSINFAIIFSEKIHHDDVRSHGSGNAGSTNMLRTYGVKSAALTFLGDVLKAVVSALIGLFVMPYQTGFMYVTALVCMIGHAFPIYYGFKGGKGVACLAGVILVVNPPLFVLMFFVFAFILLLTNYVSLGSIICAVVFPIMNNIIPFYVSPVPPVGIIAAVLMGLFVIFLHRKNIGRLLKGEESKVSLFKKKK
ncbi:MAG: glycerol-3-phosphate 1-O-acyltransferase PlsY [Clostridia bacterium]|nr:glycerol-3-phosphate 1-O-acyltransferase PlsY [Clostridia bacterium]